MPPPRSPSAFPSCAISSPRRSASSGPDTTPGSRSVRCPASRPARRALRPFATRSCPGDPVGPEVVVRLIERVGRWFDARVQLASTAKAVMAHPVPHRTASWFYVFGSAALLVFVLQIITGILLALIYVPSAGEAWNTLHTLNQHLSAGWV